MLFIRCVGNDVLGSTEHHGAHECRHPVEGWAEYASSRVRLHRRDPAPQHGPDAKHRSRDTVQNSRAW